VLYEGYDPSTQSGTRNFLARSGSLKVNHVDFNAGGGSMDVVGTNVHLVEWDLESYARINGGRCYDVASFAISGTFGPLDGGLGFGIDLAVHD
jgi:hypothetical protein